MTLDNMHVFELSQIFHRILSQLQKNQMILSSHTRFNLVILMNSPLHEPAMGHHTPFSSESSDQFQHGNSYSHRQDKRVFGNGVEDSSQSCLFGSSLHNRRNSSFTEFKCYGNHWKTYLNHVCLGLHYIKAEMFFHRIQVPWNPLTIYLKFHYNEDMSIFQL